MGWTPNQKQAIDAPVGDILVTAAAGSGKTAVMVERIINRILSENGTDVDRMLIVTYTNAAAAEIKDRIMKAIIKKIDEGENKNLERQLVLINNASICTIHSFCLDIIRSNFNKINLDPAFKIGNENDLEILLDEAINCVFEEYYKSEDAQFANLVRCYSARSDDAFAGIIKDLYKFSRSIPSNREWLINQPQNDCKKTTDVLLRLAKFKATEIVKLYKQIIVYCKADKLLLDKVNFFAAEMEPFNKLLTCNDWDTAYKLMQCVDFATCRFPKGCDEYAKDKIQTIRKVTKDMAKGILISYITGDYASITKEAQEVAEPIKLMCRLALEVGDAFAEAKQRKNIIDFSDFEHMCLQILSNNGGQSEVAVDVMNKYDEIYIDEYQDCNTVQEAIFNLISGKNKGKPNVFSVGDMKQSIYKFRDANPKLFKYKSDTYPIYEEDNYSEYSKILLNTNFRSSQPVINCVNSVFRQLMTEAAGELVYNKDEYLYCGSKCYTDDNNDKKYTDVVFVSSNVSEGYTPDENGEEDDLAEFSKETAEATYIAERIAAMINDPKYLVYDKKLEKYRHIEYHDIVILMRGIKSNASAFSQVFKQKGIPLFVDVLGYFDSPEIDFLINILKVTDNPLDDISLVAVMHHPVFCFTDDELMKIRNCCQKGYFYYAVKAYSKNDDYLAVKCKKFIKLIRDFYDMSKYMSVNMLLEKIVSQTEYMVYLSTLENSNVAKSNVRMLYTKANDFETNNFKGIFNFVNYIEKIRTKGMDSDSAKLIDENDNVVRVMTIHKSKGLEFPVVFLARATTKFNKRDLTSAVLTHKDFGVGVNVIDYARRISYPTAIKNAIRYSMECEDVSEDLRILYVALTRAREKLIIVGHHNDYKKLLGSIASKLVGESDVISPNTVLRCNSFMDWIVMATIRNPSAKYKSDENLFEVNDNSSFVYKSVYADDLEASDVMVNDVQPVPFDSGYVGHDILQALSYEYPYRDMPNVPANISVTELKKMAMEQENTHFMFTPRVAAVPQFAKKDQKVTAAAKGTLMHLVMEKTDFTRSTLPELHEQIKHMLEKGYITQKEYEAVNAKDVLGFINSPLGQNIIANYDKFYREYSFKYIMKANQIYDVACDDDIIVQGIVDAFYIDNDGKIVIIDYKTDKITENEQKTAEKYREQLKYYSIAIEKILKTPVKVAYIYLFETGNSIKM